MVLVFVDKLVFFNVKRLDLGDSVESGVFFLRGYFYREEFLFGIVDRMWGFLVEIL